MNTRTLSVPDELWVRMYEYGVFEQNFRAISTSHCLKKIAIFCSLWHCFAMDLDWTVGNTTCAIVIMELAMNHNYTKIGQYVATLLTANDLSEIL